MLAMIDSAQSTCCIRVLHLSKTPNSNMTVHTADNMVAITVAPVIAFFPFLRQNIVIKFSALGRVALRHCGHFSDEFVNCQSSKVF